VLNRGFVGKGVGKGRSGLGGGSGSGSMSRFAENLSIIFFTLVYGRDYGELHQFLFAKYCQRVLFSDDVFG